MSPRALSPSGGLRRAVLSVAVLALVVLGALQLPGVVGDRVGDALSALNPFDVDPVDRTGPPVLQSLTALEQFKAASAYYEVVVDLDLGNGLPDVLGGDRVVYVGKGRVEALVDFSELDGRRVVRSADGTSVTVRLPAPVVGEPVLDLEGSYAAVRDEGLLTRFTGSDAERKAQLAAVRRLAAVAQGEGRLTDLAQESTTAMLRGLFGALGYTDITVTFEDSPAGGT